MERSERPDAITPRTPNQRTDEQDARPLTTAERLLAEFTLDEQQRLRLLRERFERGKLSEFPRGPRF